MLPKSPPVSELSEVMNSFKSRLLQSIFTILTESFSTDRILTVSCLSERIYSIVYLHSEDSFRLEQLDSDRLYSDHKIDSEIIHNCLNSNTSYSTIKADGSGSATILYFPYRNSTDNMVLYMETDSEISVFRQEQIKILSGFTEHLYFCLKTLERSRQMAIDLKESAEKKETALNADYFLISLLLDPFQFNENSSKNVITEFLLEQYKKFSFKGKTSEIGGDICITDTLVLKDGHSFTVFLNGDAMGKSIQGAGGALVLGAVFRAALARSKVKKNYNVFPEIWLKEIFLDLHSVFSAFNGSMFISVCLGLIHNETGLLYFFNSEHPFLAVYRDGKAFFTEDASKLPKLGFPVKTDLFYVQTFQLQDGDQLFLGSDGKDDLLIHETGEFLADEFEFLRHIENGNGELAKMSSSIKQRGRIRDDFSLMKLKYEDKYSQSLKHIYPDTLSLFLKECRSFLDSGEYEKCIEKFSEIEKYLNEFPELLKIAGKFFYNREDYIKSIEYFDMYVQEVPSDNPFLFHGSYAEMLKFLGELFFRISKYEEASDYLEEYLYLCPGDNEMVFLLSSVYFRRGNFMKSADFGELLYLRDRDFQPNLKILANVYFNMKEKTRALHMADRALGLMPDDSELKELRERIHLL